LQGTELLLRFDTKVTVLNIYICRAKWGEFISLRNCLSLFCRRSKDSEKLDVFRPATESRKDNYIITGHNGSKLE